jgi:hypothetical protein
MLAERYGWTFDAIDEMSFEQIESACRGGKPEKLTARSLDEAVEIAKNWREYYRI